MLDGLDEQLCNQFRKELGNSQSSMKRVPYGFLRTNSLVIFEQVCRLIKENVLSNHEILGKFFPIVQEIIEESDKDVELKLPLIFSVIRHIIQAKIDPPTQSSWKQFRESTPLTNNQLPSRILIHSPDREYATQQPTPSFQQWRQSIQKSQLSPIGKLQSSSIGRPSNTIQRRQDSGTSDENRHHPVFNPEQRTFATQFLEELAPVLERFLRTLANKTKSVEIPKHLIEFESFRNKYIHFHSVFAFSFSLTLFYSNNRYQYQ